MGVASSPDDVQRMMWELRVEYVISNPQLFKTAAVKQMAGFNWPDFGKFKLIAATQPPVEPERPAPQYHNSANALRHD